MEERQWNVAVAEREAGEEGGAWQVRPVASADSLCPRALAESTTPVFWEQVCSHDVSGVNVCPHCVRLMHVCTHYVSGVEHVHNMLKACISIRIMCKESMCALFKRWMYVPIMCARLWHVDVQSSFTP